MDDRSPLKLTARSAEDLVAMVPVVLGFAPSDSLVMLTFGAGPQFHARVDLPRGPRAVVETAAVLLAPAQRHGVPTIALVAYGGDDAVCRRAVRAVRRRALRAGISVAEVLRVHDGRWFPLSLDPGDPRARRGVPVDPACHPFVAHAVLRGHVVLDSRDELAASILPDAREVAAVSAVADPEPVDGPWVAATVGRHVTGGTRPAADEAARLLAGLAEPATRDAAWARFRRETSREEVEFWRDLVRRSPERWVGHAAAVLAMACWVAGQGALGWCAVDRSVGAVPGHSLARLVSDLLASAASPDQWEEMSRVLRSA